MAPVDPVLRDLILIRSAAVVGDRHGLSEQQVHARWRRHNTYGVEKVRRFTKHILATADQQGTLPEVLTEVAHDIRLGEDVSLADVLTDPAHAEVRQHLATGPRRA